MVMLDGRGGLAIADIVFYVPALPIAIYAGFKHGFGKSAGWYFLILLALVRIVGASLQLAVEIQGPTNTSLIAAAIALSGVGTGPLCLATLGLIKRLYDDMHHKIVPARVFWLLGILPLVGLILSIVGGVNASSGSSKDLSGAVKYLQIAAILYIAVVVLEIVVAAIMAVNLGDIVHSERKMYYAVCLALPFLLVRVIYSVLAAYNFINLSSPFNQRTGSIFVQAFMASMEEFIVVLLLLGAAMLTQKKTPSREADTVMDDMKAHGQQQPHYHQYSGQQYGQQYGQQTGTTRV